MLRRLKHLRNNESGFALVMALGAMVVLSAVTVTVIDYSVQNQHNADTSKVSQNAYALAEAALNNAQSMLAAPSANALDAALLQSAPTDTDCDVSGTTCKSKVYSTGTAKWRGTLNTATNVWTIYAYGFARNPTIASKNIVRKIKATVNVIADPTQPYNAVAWDYVISTATGNTCDQTIADGNNTGNPAIVNTRLYVFGNLCLGTSQGGVGQVMGGPLHVRGKVYINNGSASVGTSATPVPNGVHIAQGCKLLSNAVHTPCTTADRVWASPAADAVVDNTITAPTANFASWYTAAAPGPTHACTSTTGTVPTWDSNGTFNNSVATSFNLTPASSYSCIYSVSGQPYGELSWVASTKTLTVKGTIFIDGSAQVANGAMNLYNGQGTLYLGGTFYMSNGSKLCGSANGANCDWAAWNPNSELLGIVANATGGPSNPNAAGVSIWMFNAEFQGALYGTGTVRPEGTTQTQGPMIASEVELGYNVSTASQVSNGFPMITNIPAGLPGVQNTHATPGSPVYVG